MGGAQHRPVGRTDSDITHTYLPQLSSVESLQSHASKPAGLPNSNRQAQAPLEEIFYLAVVPEDTTVLLSLEEGLRPPSVLETQAAKLITAQGITVNGEPW